jgi:hypothetical protein
VTYHRYNMGAIDVDTRAGAVPYLVEGNPVVALLAQLNRFVGKTVKGPGCPAGQQPTYPYDRPIGSSSSRSFQLLPALSEDAATAAVQTAYARYACAPTELQQGAASVTQNKIKWLIDAMGSQSQWSFVMNNLDELTTTIAQFGDRLGYPAASVGITKVDPLVAPKANPFIAVAVIGLAIGAFFMLGRKS